MSYALALRGVTPHSAALAVLRGGFRRQLALGSITPQQAASEVMPTSTIRSTAGFTQQDFNNIVQAATIGNFVSFNPSGCSGIAPSGAKIVNTAGGLALTGLSTGLAVAGVASAIAAPVTFGASLLVGLFGSIFAHHAQAVRVEQQTVCAAVPAAADSLTAIDQAVKSGTITPSQAITALQSLQSSFEAQVAGIIKMSNSACNAACIWVKQLEAIVLKKSADYEDMQTMGQAAALPAVSGSAAAIQTTTGQISSDLATVPTWGWLAAAAVLFFVVTR